jgi:signal transduction histidine kinase
VATAKIHFQPQRRRLDVAQVRQAALHVMQAQRSDEVLPILLEEIVALGYARAAVLEANLQGGDLTPVAALNWPQPQLARFTTMLWVLENPLAGVLAANRSAVLPRTQLHSRPLYLHPMLYSNANPCWEADPGSPTGCLAVQNFRHERSICLADQICSTCRMHAYAALVVVEMRRHNAETELAALGQVIEVANEHLSRLTKGEYYFNRMRSLESTLAEVTPVKPSPKVDPVLLSDNQHSTLMQNKAKVERRMLEIEKFAAAGRLAATIAHEVNNPMEAIKNAVYLLSGSVPENAMPVYGILKSETERVARVVRQMLGLYRETEPLKPVNVNTIIEDTLLLLNRQMQRANVQVTIDLGVLPDAIIAADQIRQVLSNLVINARDAMPEGGKLRIRSRHIIGHGNVSSWVRILIADSGTGIPPEIIHDIFEPFVTTKGEKGTGLGLWIVKGIIQNHGGKLSVRSRVGRGTVFRVDLPITKP